MGTYAVDTCCCCLEVTELLSVRGAMGSMMLEEEGSLSIYEPPCCSPYSALLWLGFSTASSGNSQRDSCVCYRIERKEKERKEG
jgi:hypothetical protein